MHISINKTSDIGIKNNFRPNFSAESSKSVMNAVLEREPQNDVYEKQAKTPVGKMVAVTALSAVGVMAVAELALYKGKHLKAIFKQGKDKTDNVIKDNVEVFVEENVEGTSNIIKENIEVVSKVLSEKESIESKLYPLLEEMAQIRIELKNMYNRVLKGDKVPAQDVEEVLNKYASKQSEYVNLEWNASPDYGYLFENKHSIFADKLEAYLQRLGSEVK